MCGGGQVAGRNTGGSDSSLADGALAGVLRSIAAWFTGGETGAVVGAG